MNGAFYQTPVCSEYLKGHAFDVIILSRAPRALGPLTPRLSTSLTARPFLVFQHTLDCLDELIQITHGVREIALDIVVASVCTGRHSNAKVAILPDEASGPLLPHRHIRTI
ncbi:hypothetical protein HZ326_22889 [Fusarium oxysporum f. sp. albedinis]|nr:hypothetical protein HZ326_22889 [Fusarium oxysporum f. sp. albedinis]